MAKSEYTSLKNPNGWLMMDVLVATTVMLLTLPPFFSFFKTTIEHQMIKNRFISLVTNRHAIVPSTQNEASNQTIMQQSTIQLPTTVPPLLISVESSQIGDLTVVVFRLTSTDFSP